MTHRIALSLPLMAALLVGGCTETPDPLAPGSSDGVYALGIKALVPLAVGNRWTYDVTVTDTLGAEQAHYTYTLSVLDTITADTSQIKPLPPNQNRKYLTRAALLWYLLEGEEGARTCWQVDTLENLRFRKADDTRFYEQHPFNFRAAIGDVTPTRYIGPDTITWGSGDVIMTGADSVRSTLVSKGNDTLRTTLGSAPYYVYRESYARRTDVADYYYKPGFGLFLIERFARKSDGTMVRIRRDELVSYYFR